MTAASGSLRPRRKGRREPIVQPYYTSRTSNVGAQRISTLSVCSLPSGGALRSGSSFRRGLRLNGSRPECTPRRADLLSRFLLCREPSHWPPRSPTLSHFHPPQDISGISRKLC